MDTAGTGIRFVVLNKALGVLGKGSQGGEEALLEQGTWRGRTGAVGEDPHFSGHASCRGGGNGPRTLSWYVTLYMLTFIVRHCAEGLENMQISSTLCRLNELVCDCA